MLETTIHFGPSPIAVCVVDASGSLLERATDNQANSTAAAQAQLARQASEREAIERVLERLNEVATQFVEQRQSLLREMQQVSIELAVAVASQAIYAKIEAGDFAIEALARAAIERIQGAGPLVIHLHPDDLSLLNRRLGDKPGQHFSHDVRFESDASLGRGDCRAETSEFGVWCKMQSQLEQMRQRLLENLGDAEIERRKTAADDSGLRRFPDRRQTA